MKHWLLAICLLVLAGLCVGCGGGGGGGGDPGGEEGSSDWDQLTWDQDDWA